MPYILSAQNIPADKLIGYWKADDISQTIKAEETYRDLRVNFDPAKFNQICEQIENVIREKPDERLHIRFTMYKILRTFNAGESLSRELVREFDNIMKSVVMLGDKQLLSEAYTLYAEHGPGNIEDRLFYLNTAVEIQEEIGDRYFPLIYQRFIFVTWALYNLHDYEQALLYGKKALSLGESSKEFLLPFLSPRRFIGNYCILSDLVGASYYELGDAENAISYYNNIRGALRDYQSNYSKQAGYDPEFIKIWDGVAKGGIAKGYYLQRKFDQAVPLLRSNITSALESEQFNDAAKAQNTLAQINFERDNSLEALALWKQSSRWARKSNDNKHLAESLQGIAGSYLKLQKFDSAYYYNELYHQLQLKIFNNLNQSKLKSINERVEYEKIKNRLSEAQSRIISQRHNRNFIISAFIILVVIGLLTYNRYRLKQNIKYQKLEAEQKFNQIEIENARAKMDFAEEQLKSFKNKLIQNTLVIETVSRQRKNDYGTLSQLANSTILTNEDWDKFKTQFCMVYPSFMQYMEETHPTLTKAEVRYLCLVKLELNHKEIASALGVSPASLRVTWHRLRQKLALEKDISSHQFLKDNRLL